MSHSILSCCVPRFKFEGIILMVILLLGERRQQNLIASILFYATISMTLETMMRERERERERERRERERRVRGKREKWLFHIFWRNEKRHKHVVVFHLQPSKKEEGCEKGQKMKKFVNWLVSHTLNNNSNNKPEKMRVEKWLFLPQKWIWIY